MPIIDPHLLHGIQMTRLGRAAARGDEPDDDTRTPFAVVIPWREDDGMTLEALPTMQALGAAIDRVVPPAGTRN